MEIILSNGSDKPIYEQIACQLRDSILSGQLKAGEQLPSIRALATDLRVSVITTKRAYQDLEAQGFVETVQGKGTFVSGGNMELLRERQMVLVEQDLKQALARSEAAGLTLSEIHEMLDVLAEESD